MTLKKTAGSVLHGNNAAHAAMREFNGLCDARRTLCCITTVRDRVSTCCGTPLSLNGMHIYGVTVPGVHVTRVFEGREREEEKVEREREGEKRLAQQRPRRVWLRRQA